MTSEPGRTFDRAGRRVARRLWLVRWLAGVERSSAFVCGLLIAAALLAVWGGRALPGPYVVAATIVSWPAAVALWSRHRRPRPDAALALWDETVGRGESFVTAWWLERLPAPTPFEKLHLRAAASGVGDALAGLPQDFPLPRIRRAVLFPVVACVLIAVLAGRLAPAEEQPLTDEARARAAEAAAQLAERPKLPENLERTLDEEERDRFKQLQKDLDETTDKLRSLKDERPRDLLDELERRAFDADRLSQALANDASQKVSSAMLAEMERHADTSELATALRADDLEKAAEEAKKLADRLDRKDLTLEERRRIEQALAMSMKAASEQDRSTPVGKALSEADQELKKQKQGLASKKLRELAEHLKRQGLRKKTQKQLQQLAKQLRESGSKILGSKNEGLQKLARNDTDLRSLSGEPQSGAEGALDDGSQESIIERLSMQTGDDSGDPSRSGAKAARLARPGERPDGKLIRGRPGAGPSGTQPVVRIPIPGTLPGGMPSDGSGAPIPGGAGADPGLLAGAGMGQSPIPGSIPGAGAGAAMSGGPGAGVGGSQAGRGAGGYTPTPTAVKPTTQTGAVSGRPTGEGPSQFRSTDLDERPEDVARSARDLAVEFLKVEEASLDEELLPLARREQVLRYFTAIRRRLTEPKADAPRP